MGKELKNGASVSVANLFQHPTSNILALAGANKAQHTFNGALEGLLIARTMLTALQKFIYAVT